LIQTLFIHQLALYNLWKYIQDKVYRLEILKGIMIIYLNSSFDIFCIILAAMTYLKSNPNADVNNKVFKTACGIDVSYTPEQIEDCVCC